MNKRTDGGPAFPTGDREEYQESANRLESWQHEDHRGMSLRDYFAGQAIALFSLNEKEVGQLAAGYPRHDYVAEFCYDLADAMLAEREADE